MISFTILFSKVDPKFKLFIFKNISGTLKNSGINSWYFSFILYISFILKNNLSGASNLPPWISVWTIEKGFNLTKK